MRALLTPLLWIFALAAAAQGQSCRAPSKCVQLRKCDTIHKTLADNKRPMAPAQHRNMFDLIDSCGTARTTVYSMSWTELQLVPICCPADYERLSVMQHPNLHLLPHDSCGIPQPEDSITLGESTDINQYPFMALLITSEDNGLPCGGSLINDRYVLTAAHCFDGRTKPDIVRLGEYDTGSDPDCQRTADDKDTICSYVQTYNINMSMVKVHGSYKKNGMHDIALIRLPRAADLSADNVRPICLPWTDSLQEERISQYIVTGWGKTIDNDQPRQLLQIKLPAVSQKRCGDKWSMKMNSTTVCAGGVLGMDTCKGDSGGPMFAKRNDMDRVKYVLFGVCSHGLLECSEWNDRPTIFSNVKMYMTWILNHIKK